MSRTKSFWSVLWSKNCSHNAHPLTRSRQQLRTQSTNASQQMDLGRHFYLNKILEQYAAKPASRTTLRQLVFFGKRLGQDRDKILKSANYVRQELAVRIAHRIRDLQALPYSVMNHQSLENVYQKYWSAFEVFRKMPTIRTLEDNEEFCTTLKGLLQDHLTIIPSLTIGIVESSNHLPPEQLDGFMERMLRSRISRRVLAEQHIALSEALDDPFHFFNDSSSAPPEKNDNDGEHVGIIYTSLKVSSVVEKSIRLLTRLFEEEIQSGIRQGDAAVLPVTVVDGALEARFAYIPEHLEYIMFELLKNSMMAVMRQPVSTRDPVCIRVTIVEGPPDEDLIIRISDCGGGLPSSLISKTVVPSIRDHKRRLGHRGSSSSSLRKRKDALEDDSIAALQGEQKEDQQELALDDDLPTSIYPPVEESQDEIRSAMGINRGPPNATANKAGVTDPLIAAVTSFSNIRRRLEMEERRLKKERQLREKEVTASTDDDDSKGEELGDSVWDKKAIQMGLRAGLKDHEERASGIDSWAKLEALRNVGRFKGTVAEQIPRSERKQENDSHGGGQDNSTSTTQSSISLKRAETGLGLPMTKIYTDFFGGSLSLRSLDGHGMDVFVRLPKLGTNKEAIEDIVL